MPTHLFEVRNTLAEKLKVALPRAAARGNRQREEFGVYHYAPQWSHVRKLAWNHNNLHFVSEVFTAVQ
jgi:hypothetical protein